MLFYKRSEKGEKALLSRRLQRCTVIDLGFIYGPVLTGNLLFALAEQVGTHLRVLHSKYVLYKGGLNKLNALLSSLRMRREVLSIKTGHAHSCV